MAYLISIPEKFLQADGSAFRIPKRDKDRDLVLRKTDDGQVLVGSDGSAMIEMQDASFTDIMRTFLNGMFKLSEQRRAVAMQNKKDVNPEHELVMEDSAFAGDIFRAMNVVADGVMELEKAPYEWILKQIDVWGVDLYGINAAVLKEVFKSASDGGTDRAERRREEVRNGKIESDYAYQQ